VSDQKKKKERKGKTEKEKEKEGLKDRQTDRGKEGWEERKLSKERNAQLFCDSVGLFSLPPFGCSFPFFSFFLLSPSRPGGGG
jgi:hypothetical protein